MTDHKVNIYRAARECGVILRDRHPYSPQSRKPYECYCKHSVREIGKEHGEGHIKLVFMLMTGTIANASEIYVDAFRAVSGVIASDPSLEKRPTLIDDFNAMDIGAMRKEARSMSCGIPSTYILRVLMVQHLSRRGNND